jgi:uncharacterized protein YndB with AHSA1/START domain
MDEKEKIQLEYVFNKISKNSLWNYLTTPTGLTEWFADDVSVKGNSYLFTWNKNSQEAEKTAAVNQSFIRFKWIDDDTPDAYFEFKIQTVEITGAIALEITDFVKPEEKEETVNLWETQIRALRRSLGI